MSKKIYNEIKYLCKVATAGSKEARELEKVKKAFENAWKESVAQKNTTDEGDVKLSVREDFAEQLQDWKNGYGKAYGKYNGSYFNLGTTSDILVKHGATKTDLIMYEDCILKVTGGKHSISLDEIAKLPYELDDPVLLFKGSVDNSFVALTEMVDKEGNDIIVAVHINKKHKRTVINKIASIYSKSDDFGNNKIINYVSKQISDGNLLDASIKKAPMWFTNRGLQLPKLVQTIIDANNSISNPTKKVNTTNEKRQDRDSLKHSDRNIELEINHSMTMAEAKQMIQRAFVLGNIYEWYEGEYKNGDEWLRGEGSYEVSLNIENEYSLVEKYLNKIQGYIDGDIYVEAILEAYLNGTLVGKEKPKAKRMDISKNYRVNDTRFYSPKRIENVKQLFEIARQKLTSKNRAEVLKVYVEEMYDPGKKTQTKGRIN